MSDPDTARTSARFWRLGLLLVLMAAWSGALAAGFVWDDRAIALGNAVLDAPWSWSEVFTSDLWAGTGQAGAASYYRPLMTLSLLLDRALWGTSAAGAHLQNLAWHLAAVGGLYALVRRLAGAPAALFAALWFGLQPGQAEAVVWVSARNDLMAAAFGVWALWAVCPVDGAGRSRVVHFAASGLLALAAVWSKESALMLPIIGVVVMPVGGWRARVRAAAALGAGVTAAVAARWVVGVGLPDHILALPSRPLAAAIEVVAVVAGGAVHPWPSVGTWQINAPLAPSWWAALGGVWAVVLVGAVWALRSRRSLAVAGLVWAALAWLPAVAAVLSRGLVGPRYAYGAHMGLGLALGVLLVRSLPRAWWGAVGVGLALPFAVTLNAEMDDWRDDAALWQGAVRDAPSPFAMNGHGRQLWTLGAHKQATGWLVAAIAAEPPYLGDCDVAVAAAERAGGGALALRVGQWGLTQGCPLDGELGARLALAAAATGDLGGALAWLDRAPPDPRGRDVVVRAAACLARGDEACVDAFEVGWTGDRSVRVQAQGLLEAAGLGRGQQVDSSGAAPPAPGVQRSTAEDTP